MIERPPKSVEGRAEYYRVNERTVKRWNAKAAPLHSVEEMAKWMLLQKRMPQGFVTRMEELTGSRAQVEPKQPDLDWAQFKATMGSRPKKEFSLLIQQMEEFAAFYHYKLERAHETGDKGDQRFFNDLFIETSNSIRQQKLAADKLGIEEGQLFTKAQLEKFIRAFAFWAMRAIDADLAELCPKLVGLKSVNDARGKLEPVLLSARFVKPFARASRVESDSALSPWMVETVNDAVDDFIEKGAEEFDMAAKT